MDAFLVRLGLLFALCLYPQPSLAQPASDTVATSAKVGSQLQILSSGLGNAAPNLRDDEPEEKAESPAEKVDAPAPEQEGQDAAAQAAQENVAPATGAAPASGLIPEIKAPTSSFPEAKGNGSLGYSFAIDAPDFRGLEPDIALTYVSNRKTKTGGSYQGWLGYGWGVDGIAVIERARPRGGVPAYAAGDVFVMNGTELVTCAAGMVSPSCATGGTHATENESYRRIRYLSGTVQWEIADRDGTKTVLSSVGTIADAGTLTPGTDAYALAYQYRWLVTSVTDTHGNAVTYSYVCPELPTCYPNTITYNGSTIRFYREARPDYLLVANGRTLSEITTRIKTIAVLTGGVLRAAYGLDYDQAPVSGASRLVKIRQFGRDATVSGSGAISGGTERPETVLTYAGFSGQYDTLPIGSGSGSTSTPDSANRFVDLNSDGKDEALTFTEESTSARVTSWSIANSVTDHGLISVGNGGSGDYPSSFYQGLVGRYVAAKKEAYWLYPLYGPSAALTEFNVDLTRSEATCPATPNPIPSSYCNVFSQPIHSLPISADPDGDGVDAVFDLGATLDKLIGKSDLFGNGRDQLLMHRDDGRAIRLYQYNGAAWTFSTPQFRDTANTAILVTCHINGGVYRLGCRVGDFNGDGVDDLIEITTTFNVGGPQGTIFTYSTNSRIFLGTGDRFIQKSLSGGGGGIADQSAVADLDDDGRMELFASNYDAEAYFYFLETGSYNFHPAIGPRFTLGRRLITAQPKAD